MKLIHRADRIGNSRNLTTAVCVTDIVCPCFCTELGKWYASLYYLSYRTKHFIAVPGILFPHIQF
jgi:hypothetical protein